MEISQNLKIILIFLYLYNFIPVFCAILLILTWIIQKSDQLILYKLYYVYVANMIYKGHLIKLNPTNQGSLQTKN